jgi:hypothetical protein
MGKKRPPNTYEETHDHGLPELDVFVDDKGLYRWEVVQPDGHWGVWRTGAHAERREATLQGRTALFKIMEEHFPSEAPSIEEFWEWYATIDKLNYQSGQYIA